uniref:Uncharacterized protein n=1 Tax=Oryza glumipatula TaxID=40148 RepID=A0A0E0B7T7_9ORYZ
MVWDPLSGEPCSAAPPCSATPASATAPPHSAWSSPSSTSAAAPAPASTPRFPANGARWSVGRRHLDESISGEKISAIDMKPPVLVGNVLYWLLVENCILEFNMDA